MQRAESLSTKSVNQYRTRDVFAYLALRYCSDNDFARSNFWVENHATQIVFASKQGSYLRSYHFKQFDENGTIEHREFFIPSASEALAEAALLAECAKYVDNSEFLHVFSYRPTQKEDRKSCFEPYMTGLRLRQSEIASYCSKHPDGIVAYIDIRKFYPSISTNIATDRWDNFCKTHKISEFYSDLGLKLISNYKLRSDTNSILTGPMFSHFLANLVLYPIDKFSMNLPAHYLRYVDDMTLVGNRADVEESINKLDHALRDIGLEIHPLNSPKTLLVPTAEWQDSAADFSQGEHAIAWMKLIGDIKKILLFNKSKSKDIEEYLREEGFRLPIPDYTLAISEASSFERIRKLGLWNWLKFKTKRVTIESISEDARKLSNRLHSETIAMLKDNKNTTKFQRKRVISKLRYRLGRLIYIGTEKDLKILSNDARDWPELKFHVAVMDALISSDCFEVVSMGSNVAQAAAQIIRPTMKTAWFSRPLTTEAQIQGLAVLILNGIPVEGEVRTTDHPILRFARGPIDRDLMIQPRGLLQELACLHGIGDVRHPKILDSAFDIDEHIVLDALEFDYGYYL